MAYPYPYQQPALGRSAAVDELQRAFPSVRPLNTERSALDLPLEIQPGRHTALRITLSPMFPQERPLLTVLVPVQNPSVDSGGRIRCRTLDEWDARVAGKANLVNAVREALAILTQPPGSSSTGSASQGQLQPLGQPPRHVDGPSGPSPSSSTGGQQAPIDIDSLSTSEIEQLLTDEAAFRKLLRTWISKTPAAKTLEEIQRQNVALAQDNLSMQDNIEEARNHVAVVRSSEFASVKSHFDDLFQRQEAALAKLSPAVVYEKLNAEVDKLDEASSSFEDSFLQGSLSVEQFVDQYLQQRIEYHRMDLVRQAAQHTASSLPVLRDQWAQLGQQF